MKAPDPALQRSLVGRSGLLRGVPGSVAALVLDDLLSSCACRQGGGDTPDTTLRASVDRTQIGGEGLVAPSVFGPAFPVGADGTLCLPQTGPQAQLHVLTDAADQVRALGLSVPGAEDSLRFDAASTALALVFMTVGILTTDPQAAGRRAALIRGLPSFAALAARLSEWLPCRSLPEMPGRELARLVMDCLAEYRAASTSTG